MPQTRNFNDEEMRQLGGDSVAGFFPCDHHIEPSPTPTSSVHANPDIVIDAVGSPEGCTEIALACCNAAMSKMPSFALFEDARSILVRRLIPPPRYGFRQGINLEGLSVPRTALYELMFCNTDSDELVNLVSEAGGIACLLKDTVHLATTVALPLIHKQMQCIKDTAPSQAIQTSKIEPIAALLPTAPSATHGSSLVIHKGKKWVKDLVAALEHFHACSGHVRCGLCSWNTGATFLSDVLTQDSWWRLIVYFDVAGMAVTRGDLFDAFFSSQHMTTFANVLQELLLIISDFNDAWRVGCCQHHPDTIKRHEHFPSNVQASNFLHHEMLSKWVNVLLPYGQSALSEQQEAQAELDDEKAKVYGRLKSMTSHVSERDKEQVVIDLENLKAISALRHKNMGELPPELNLLLVSASHFVCRFLAACTSYARAPSIEFMRSGHACVVMLNNIAARTAGSKISSESVVISLASTGSVLITSLCVFEPFFCSERIVSSSYSCDGRWNAIVPSPCNTHSLWLAILDTIYFFGAHPRFISSTSCGMPRLPYLIAIMHLACDPSRLSQSSSDADVSMSLWDAVCHCTVSEILSSNNSHSAGRSSDWLQMRALLHMKCPELVDSCLTSANKLGAPAAGNAMWLLLSLCEYVCVPICESDACSCDQAGEKKKRTVDAPSTSKSTPPQITQLSISEKYVQTQILCSYCCIKRIIAAILHICTSVSSVARPSTIPIPDFDEDILAPHDDYLSVPDWMPRSGYSEAISSPSKQTPKLKGLPVNSPPRSAKRASAVKGRGPNSISAEEQERLQAVEETIKALKVHSKRDVLCCWRNGLWTVARCIKTLRASNSPSLTQPLFDFATKFEGSLITELISPAMSSGVCPTVAACACLATLIDDGMVLVDFLASLARAAVIAVTKESSALTFAGSSVLLAVLNRVLSPEMSDDDRLIVKEAIQDRFPDKIRSAINAGDVHGVSVCISTVQGLAMCISSLLLLTIQCNRLGLETDDDAADELFSGTCFVMSEIFSSVVAAENLFAGKSVAYINGAMGMIGSGSLMLALGGACSSAGYSKRVVCNVNTPRQLLVRNALKQIRSIMDNVVQISEDVAICHSKISKTVCLAEHNGQHLGTGAACWYADESSAIGGFEGVYEGCLWRADLGEWETRAQFGDAFPAKAAQDVRAGDQVIEYLALCCPALCSRGAIECILQNNFASLHEEDDTHRLLAPSEIVTRGLSALALSVTWECMRSACVYVNLPENAPWRESTTPVVVMGLRSMFASVFGRELVQRFDFVLSVTNPVGYEKCNDPAIRLGVSVVRPRDLDAHALQNWLEESLALQRDDIDAYSGLRLEKARHMHVQKGQANVLARAWMCLAASIKTEDDSTFCYEFSIDWMLFHSLQVAGKYVATWASTHDPLMLDLLQGLCMQQLPAVLGISALREMRQRLETRVPESISAGAMLRKKAFGSAYVPRPGSAKPNAKPDEEAAALQALMYSSVNLPLEEGFVDDWTSAPSKSSDGSLSHVPHINTRGLKDPPSANATAWQDVFFEGLNRDSHQDEDTPEASQVANMRLAQSVLICLGRLCINEKSINQLMLDKQQPVCACAAGSPTSHAFGLDNMHGSPGGSNDRSIMWWDRTSCSVFCSLCRQKMEDSQIHSSFSDISSAAQQLLLLRRCMTTKQRRYSALKSHLNRKWRILQILRWNALCCDESNLRDAKDCWQACRAAAAVVLACVSSSASVRDDVVSLGCARVLINRVYPLLTHTFGGVAEEKKLNINSCFAGLHPQPAPSSGPYPLSSHTVSINECCAWCFCITQWSSHPELLTILLRSGVVHFLLDLPPTPGSIDLTSAPGSCRWLPNFLRLFSSLVSETESAVTLIGDDCSCSIGAALIAAAAVARALALPGGMYLHNSLSATAVADLEEARSQALRCIGPRWERRWSHVLSQLEVLRPFENFDLKLENVTAGSWCVAVPYSVCWGIADILIYSGCSRTRTPLLQQSAQGTVALLFAANLPQVVHWLHESPENHEKTRKILSSDLREFSEVSPPVKEFFLKLEERRRLLHCIDACARACLLLQRVTSDGETKTPDGVLEYVQLLILAAAEHLSKEDHIMNLRKLILIRSSITALCTIASECVNSAAAQCSSANPTVISSNPITPSVLQAVITICDRSRALLDSVPHLRRSTSSFEALRRNITSSSPHIVPSLDPYTSRALSCSVSLPIVEMLVKTTNLMFMSQFTWPLDAPLLSFTFDEAFSKTYLPVAITQCLEASSRALELQALSFVALNGLVTDTIHILEVCMCHPELIRIAQPLRSPSIRSMLRRLLLLDVESIVSPQLLTSALHVGVRVLFHRGGDCNVDISELLKDRQSSIFEFMNEDQGSQIFRLHSATSVLSGVLQCFTSQDYMHAAVTDKYKRRVTWHRSMPFNFAETVDTNCLLFTSGMFFSQKLEASSEIKQCIDYCRKLSWCPSSLSYRAQQQSESCFMSALLLHTICVSHPLFTFCGAIADAVPRLLGWMQRPILLSTTDANPKHVVSSQPQSLDTWMSPALPLEVHTLERVLACLALMSQSKQGVELLRSDDSLPCIARIWDALSSCCGCIVKGEGSASDAAITQHLVRIKGTSVLVACLANALGLLANIALDQSGCIRVAGLISPQAILNCLLLEQLLWSDAAAEISSHPNADILLAMLKCASSSSNGCTIASQASALLTNVCLNKTVSSVYCTCTPLLVALDQARKSLNDAARTFLFYASHALDWAPLLLQWSSRHSMYDTLGSALTAVAALDIAVDRLQVLHSSVSSATVSMNSSPGSLPVPHLENFLNVAAFRGDSAQAGSTISVDSTIGDTIEEDSETQSVSKPSLSSSKLRTWGRVAAAVKKTKNVKQIPQDCGLYALSFSYRTPSLDDPDVSMALSDRAVLMEFTSGFKNLCGLSRRPCVTVACPTQHIWQRCQPVLVLNLGLGTVWAMQGSMITCSNIIRSCNIGRCCVRSMEWILWVVATLADRSSSDMLLKLCSLNLLASSTLSSLLSWCFSASISRFNFDANRSGSSRCVLVTGAPGSSAKNWGVALLQSGCGCSVCCRVLALAVISEMCGNGGDGGLGPLLQEEMRKCGLLSVIDDAVSTQQDQEQRNLTSCRSVCSSRSVATVATSAESLTLQQSQCPNLSAADVIKLQNTSAGARLIASSLMVLITKVFSNKSILAVVECADTSGSTLIYNLISLLRSAWTHEISHCMTTWASDSVRGVISVAITDRPSNLLAFASVAPFSASMCDVVTQSPFSQHAFAMEEKRPFLFSMPWQSGSACLVLQALIEAFEVTSYAQKGCILLPSLVGEAFRPCMQLLACITRSSVSSRKSNLAHWDACRLLLITLRQFCGCCNTLLLSCMWRRRCSWFHNLHQHLASGLKDLISIRRCVSNAISSTPDQAFKLKLKEILDLVLAVCSNAALSFSHFLLDEHASAELTIFDESTCELMWMLTVLLWDAAGSVAWRRLYQSCAAALSCCLMASHPSALMGLQDPKNRMGLDFVPIEMKQLQHSPAWYPSGDGSCKRQLSRNLACAASAFDFDNEFSSMQPAKITADCLLMLLQSNDLGMMQRSLNALHGMCFVESTLAVMLDDSSLLQFVITRMRLSFWIKICSTNSSQSSSTHQSHTSPHGASSTGDHQNILHQVVQCGAGGHAAVISRSFRPGLQVMAEGVQALMSSSIEANAVFKQCLTKLWRLGFAEFRSLDRLARASRGSCGQSQTFIADWNSSVGQVTRFLQNVMRCCSILLQRSATLTQSAKTAALLAIVQPAMSSTAWLSDFDQIISVAPLAMNRGMHQSAATLLSCIFRNLSHVHENFRDARISQLFRSGTMVKLQVLAYSWQIDGANGWAASSRVDEGHVADVMLDLWKLLPDPVVCSAMYSVAYTVLQYPPMFPLLQEVSTHAFVAASFTSIATSFNSDISAVAIAVREALPTLHAMLAIDEFRAAASGSDVVGCVVECCVRSWHTFNRLLHVDREVLTAALDVSAATVPKRQPHESGPNKDDVWRTVTSSMDPLLMWCDHYVRTSDHAQDGSIVGSSCPTPSAYAYMSLPFCHITTLSASITFIIALFKVSPALKDTIIANPGLVQLAKSAIVYFDALFSWAEPMHDSLFRECVDTVKEVAILVTEICWNHRSRQMLLQALLADEKGETDLVKSKIDNARLGWQQSKHEALQGAAEGLRELLDALAAL